MSKYVFKSALLAAAGAVALGAAAPALAQSQDDTAEVIVTLQKREQRIQEVPTSVTAYTGEFLNNQGVTEFTEVAAFVPGFEAQNQSPNNPGFVIRGITSDSLEATNEPRVSVFQDGVSISRATGAYIEMFDLERVEVAKGPQSTLFGRGALIGGINVIQNKAQVGLSDWRLSAAAGDLGYRMYEGMVNVPVGEGLAIRLAGRVKQRDGYVENVLGGDDFMSIDTTAWRAVVGLRPNDRFDAQLIFNRQSDSPSATAFKSMTVLPASPTTGAVLAGQPAWEGAALAASPGFGKELGTKRTVSGVTLLSNFRFNDAWSLSSVTAHRKFNASEVGDADGIALPILGFDRQTTADMWSQELRLRFDDGGTFAWFGGINYFKEKGRDGSPVQFDERMGLAQITGQLHAPALTGFAANRHAPTSAYAVTPFTGQLIQGLVFNLSNGNIILTGPQGQALAANLKSAHREQQFTEQDLTSWDVFTDFTFRVSPRFELGLGVRYTTDDKDVRYNASVLNGRSILGGVIGLSQLASSGNPVAVGQATALLNALMVPGAANIPMSPGYPVPMFGLTFQPTNNNGDVNSYAMSDEGFTWRLTGLYRLTDQTNLYANYARGRRPEAVGATSPSSPYGAAKFTPVPAETVDSVEAGAKFESADRRLRLDGAVYLYKYENFQTVEQVLTTFVPSNAGEATSYGFEGQAFWRTAPNIDLFGTYAYNRSRFDTGAYKGNRFRLSPDHAVSLGASVRLAVAGGELDFRPSLFWKSKIFFDDNNDLPQFQTTASQFVADTIQDEFQEAYAVANLRIAYRPETGPWKIEFFANNMFDEKYIIDAGNTGDALGLPSYIAGAPRTVGVQFTLRSW